MTTTACFDYVDDLGARIAEQGFRPFVGVRVRLDNYSKNLRAFQHPEMCIWKVY